MFLNINVDKNTLFAENYVLLSINAILAIFEFFPNNLNKNKRKLYMLPTYPIKGLQPVNSNCL